jgi:hypothetical protein
MILLFDRVAPAVRIIVLRKISHRRGFAQKVGAADK